MREKIKLSAVEKEKLISDLRRDARTLKEYLDSFDLNDVLMSDMISNYARANRIARKITQLESGILYDRRPVKPVMPKKPTPTFYNERNFTIFVDALYYRTYARTGEKYDITAGCVSHIFNRIAKAISRYDKNNPTPKMPLIFTKEKYPLLWEGQYLSSKALSPKQLRGERDKVLSLFAEFIATDGFVLDNLKPTHLLPPTTTKEARK